MLDSGLRQNAELESLYQMINLCYVGILQPKKTDVKIPLKKSNTFYKCFYYYQF